MFSSAIRLLSDAERMVVLRIALAGLALLAVNACRPETGDQKAVRRAIDAVLAERFTLARLTSQTSWQSCDAPDTALVVVRVRCGQSPLPGTEQYDRLASATRLFRPIARTDSTPLTLRAGALLELRWLSSSPGAIDRAIASLERARRRDSTGAAVLNDLAVAYLEKGQRDQDLQPMIRALDAVELALERDSMLTAALFNRALILDRLYLIESARRAWSRYLAVEKNGHWRTEAEGHARRLVAGADQSSLAQVASLPAAGGDSLRGELMALVTRSPQGARDLSFTLLGEWGEAVGRGDATRAATALATARAIARALAALDVDRSVSLALASIDAAARDSVRLHRLARGHVALADGLALYAQAAYDDAIDCLGQAEDDLSRAGSPASGWATFYRGASEVNRGEYEAADERFRRLAVEATIDEPALTGKAVWALGVSQVRRGNYETAIRLYRSAREHIARAREPENEGALSYVIAEALNLAGQATAGRVDAYRGLRLLSPYRKSNFLNNHLTTVSAFARRDGSAHAALAIMQEVLYVAEQVRRPDVLAWAHRAFARELLVLGRRDAARKALERASYWVDSIPRGRGRDRVHADVQFIRAQLAREDDPRAARELLSGVVDTYTGLKANRHLAAALYETSIVARATGDQAGARSSIDRAIDAIERQSRTFESTEVRASFTETVENVFDAMMDFELARGAPDSAFAYLERGRVAAWTAAPGPSEVSTSRAASLTVDDVRAVLPDSTALIEYAVLNDRAIVWTVSKSGSRNHVVSIRRDSIAALVERALDESGSATVDSAGSLARLFDLLMKPVLEDLPGVNRLAIVPDRELGRLPFAALWDRRSARYVVESYQVRTLPSAAFFVSVAGPSRRSSSGAHALVVGDPTSDSSLAPRLPALPGALREAGRVAELYRKHRLLRGTEASRASVLDQLGASSVFHFAGHAIANGDQPELSYLALATTGADDGTLRGSEIGKLRLSNLELVVLSACSTLNPRSSHTGAIAGLAYSFLRAGAPATISTLWDVTDDVTTDLLVAFHGGYVGGAPAAEALRQAQLLSLRSSRPEVRAPRAWGAFIYTGP